MAIKFRGGFGLATDIDIVPLTLLGIFVTLVFLTGGGARADIQSLVLLRPISILFVGIALLRLKRQEILQNQFLFSMLASIVGLTIFHLIPLPPQIWHLLPGRTLTADIDNAVGLESQWRPLSLVPTATWNGLFSLAVPTAVFLMIIKVNNRYWTQLLALLLLIGLLSGLVGLLQSIGSSKGALYFYRITNNGAAVGLFANRNHQAMFLSCLFPMLAVFASTGVRTPAEAKRKLWLALASGCLLIPLILVTGSRAGLVTASIGLLSVLSLYRKPLQPTPSRRFRDRLNLRTIYCVSGAIVFALMLFLTTRASSLLQLSLSDEADELRFQMW